ncbi:MAG: bifunctional riboflavin kinase/FAD synthetase [Dehalococcoidia bacterium]|nr:bifunctional riboflavin kinase/FAD synthetase [Dehalococcoidia bacterium]
MEIEPELASIAPSQETILAIGVFDGVHAGHRHLLQTLHQRAAEQDLLSGVITFNPHPQSVLNPDDQLPSLSSLEDRIAAIQELGISMVVVLTFTTSVAGLSAREFMSSIQKHLRMRGIIVGPDVALGRGQEGNISMLCALGHEMNFSVEVVHPYIVDGVVVSSTLIRQALAQGDMTRVERLMGRRFQLRGKVISSDRRGRILGYPTANLSLMPQQALPGNGIYATVAHLEGKRYPSATSVGIRPTFGDGERRVETHLLGYEGDLYNRELRVEFVRRLRDEERFSSSEELKAQIEKDVREVEAILGSGLTSA